MYERLHRESGDLIEGRVSKYGRVSYPDGSSEWVDDSGALARAEIHAWVQDYDGPDPRYPPSARTESRLYPYMSGADKQRWAEAWGPDGTKRKEWELWERNRMTQERLEQARYLPKLSYQIAWLRSMT